MRRPALLQATPATMLLSARQVLLLDGGFDSAGLALRIKHGVLRVFLFSPAGEEITIGFLQTADLFDQQSLRRDWIGVEAMSMVGIEREERRSGAFPDTADLNGWTTELLMIRHLGETEQRLRALLSLLVERLGRRNGDWYELPLRLTHERIAELIGNTRVTVTKLVSRLRQANLLEVQACGTEPPLLRLSPAVVEGRQRLPVA